MAKQDNKFPTELYGRARGGGEGADNGDGRVWSAQSVERQAPRHWNCARPSGVGTVQMMSMPAQGVTVTPSRLGDSPDPLMGCNVDVFHLRNNNRTHEATGGT